jgi:hypothetical protein
MRIDAFMPEIGRLAMTDVTLCRHDQRFALAPNSRESAGLNVFGDSVCTHPEES